MWEVLRQRELQLVLAIRFLEAVKPSEPHLVPYLKQVKGFTNLQARLRPNLQAPWRPVDCTITSGPHMAVH